MEIFEIKIDDFVRICNESKTQEEARNKLNNMHILTFKKYCNLFGIQKFRSKRESKRYNLEDILNGKYPNYPTSKLNYRLIKENIKERKCECCGNTEWMGLPIVLELHHIDGNRTNNKLENLQLLCPNCHSVTDNFKSKKVKKYKFLN